MNYYITVLKKYAVFSGRASRAEYWYFFLFNLIVSIVLGIVDMVIFGEDVVFGVGNIYSLALLIPSLAVGVRRMHDIGNSGWFLLIPIYNIILLATKGEEVANEYGPVPDSIIIEEENPETY